MFDYTDEQEIANLMLLAAATRTQESGQDWQLTMVPNPLSEVERHIRQEFSSDQAPQPLEVDWLASTAVQYHGDEVCDSPRDLLMTDGMDLSCATNDLFLDDHIYIHSNGEEDMDFVLALCIENFDDTNQGVASPLAIQIEAIPTITFSVIQTTFLIGLSAVGCVVLGRRFVGICPEFGPRQGLALRDDAAQQPLTGDNQSRGGDPKVVSPDLDAWVGGMMKEWNVPGLTISIVEDDKTWAKGYGYATLNSTPMTPHTLFYTGSTTKSFTAAGVSLLVDNSTQYSGLNWKTPVSSILREDFVLSDEWATAHITLEDALSHRTGYPRHDLASASTTRETVRQLRHLPMSAEPRSKFQYCNKMFGVMGYLIETLTGSWLGDFLRERLWEPMGMNETYFSLEDAEKSGLTLATEYHFDHKRKKFVVAPHEPSSAEEGAGSIISNVLDYAKYLRVMMNEGGPISKDGHGEVKTPRSFADMSQPPFTGPVTYALGWFQSVYEGEVVYFHSGAVTLFVSTMIMIPSKKLAVTVMSNTETRATQLAAYHILYEHFGVPEERRFDFNEKYKSEQKAQWEYLDNCGQHIYPSIPKPPFLPTLPISDHIGEYTDIAYGTVKVELHCHDSESDWRGPKRDEGERCQLRVLGVAGVGFQYLEPIMYLEPKSGNYWVGRAYLNGAELEDVDTPVWCSRVEFKVDVGGTVTELGMDVRLEGNDGPLVWFKRVKN